MANPTPNASSSSKRVVFPEESPPPIETNDEKEPLIKTTPSPGKETPSNNSGIYIMLFITFLASVCFSIVLPSIWPFLQSMNAQPSIVGWAVAVNSAGSFLASPVFGAWADRRPTREVLGCTLVIMILGNLMYSLATNVWLLLAGRFIVGVAAANYAVAQTYLSYATNPDNRTKVMALNSAANVFGFIIGPAFALLMTFIRSFSMGGVEVNDYTMPGYLSAVMSLFGLLSLITLKEIAPGVKQKKKNAGAAGSAKYGSGFYSGGGSVKDISQIVKFRKQIPMVPVSICLFAYFSYTTSFTVFETIGTPYTKDDFQWGVNANSIMYAVLGVLCILSLVILQIFVRFFNDRILVVGATLISAAGFLVLFDIHNHLVSLPRFCIGVALCASGYSTSVAVLISIYSKALEGLDQGIMMGWLSSAGSIARIIGPVFASYSLQYGGGRVVFSTMAALILLTALVEVVGYRALIPRTIKSTAVNEA